MAARPRGRGRVAGRPSPRVLLLLGVVAVVLVVGAAAAYRLSRVAAQLDDAQAELRAAESAVRDGALSDAESRLVRAEGLVATANGSLHTSASLSLVSAVPVARQNLAALRRSVQVSLELTNGGRRVLDAARPLQGPDGHLQVALQAGAVPLGPAREVSEILKEVGFNLPASAPSSRWLLGPVRRLNDEVAVEATRRKAQFVSVGRGLELLTELAGGNGPRRYLLAVANAAEMRGTGGMILSYGSLVSDAGKITLERFGPIDDVRLDKPADVPGPPDYVRRFAALEPTRLWRSANLAADFTEVAPVMEKMYEASTGADVNGVIQIDSAGLAAVLEGIGPIDVTNLGTVDASNVVTLTLNDAYVKFPDRPVRQEYLESVARTAFDRLLSGNYPSVTGLARALVQAAAGRHVILHSSSPPIERLAATLGADGSLPPEGVNFAALTVQNLSGNKLDYYLDTKLGISGVMRPGRVSQIQLQVDLANTAPANGVPQYIFGPFSGEFVNGEYRGLASVYLPAGAALRSQHGASEQPSVTQEDGHTVVSFGVDVRAGQAATVTLDVSLPPQPPVLQGWVLVPVPRVRPTVVGLRLDTPKGTERFSGPVDRPAAFATR